MNKTQEFSQTNKQRYLSELIDLLKIPSISADQAFKNDVQRCAESLAEGLTNIGMDKVEICQTAGNPIVYGENSSFHKISDYLLQGLLGKLGELPK